MLVSPPHGRGFPEHHVRHSHRPAVQKSTFGCCRFIYFRSHHMSNQDVSLLSAVFHRTPHTNLLDPSHRVRKQVCAWEENGQTLSHTLLLFTSVMLYHAAVESLHGPAFGRLAHRGGYLGFRSVCKTSRQCVSLRNGPCFAILTRRFVSQLS